MHVVVDVRNMDRTLLTQIADRASVQAFVLAQPYIAGLNEKSVSLLNHDTLKEIFDVIKSALPEARPLNLDNILSGSINEKAVLESISTMLPSAPSGYVKPAADPGDTTAWVRENIRVLKDGNRQQLANLQYALMKYLNGRSALEIKAILARHEVFAAAEYWKGRDLGFADAVVGELGHPSGKTHVMAFDEAVITGRDVSVIRSFNERSKAAGNNLRVVVFGTSGNVPAGISADNYVTVTAGKPAAAQIMEKLGASNVANISIALAKDRDGDMADVRKDIEAYGGKALSYIVVDRAVSVDNIVQVNAAGLLRSVKTDKPYLTAIGDFDEIVLKDIERLLSRIGGFLQKIKKLSEAIPEIFYSIKTTAVAA
jgi:hypothetical protein